MPETMEIPEPIPLPIRAAVSRLTPAAGPPGAAFGKGRNPEESGMGTVEPEFMDTRHAAAVLGLSHRTLEGYRVSGGGPDFHRFGNRVRYRRSDLDAWAAARRAGTTAQADRLGPA